MTSSRKQSSRLISEKRVSQWEDLMRKFSEAHREKCTANSLDIPRMQRSMKTFPSGSQYEGSWDVLGMSGYGVYTFSNGVVYEGEFKDGLFHGDGKLLYKNGVTLVGKFQKGIMTQRTLIFDDGVEYAEENWNYCKMPDRRFAIEFNDNLKPAGESYLTAPQPTRDIPLGMLDTGDGFFDPKSRLVYKPDDLTSLIRAPDPEEQKWILDNCRSNPCEAQGPRREFYEEWSVPHEKLPIPPKPRVGYKESEKMKKMEIFQSEFDSYMRGIKPFDPKRYIGCEVTRSVSSLFPSGALKMFRTPQLSSQRN